MTKIINRFFADGINLIISTQFIIAVSALCLSIETNILFGMPLTTYPVFGFIFSGTLAVYNLAFLGNHPFRFYLHHKNIYKSIICIISFCCCFTLLFYLPVNTIILTIVSAFLSVVYLYRLKWNSIVLQIRNIPMVKNILLATIWSMVTVLIPWSVHYHEMTLTGYTLFIFFRRFFFILAIAIPYDIRDFQQDTANKLQTLPVVIGIAKTKISALFCLACFTVLVFYNSMFHDQDYFQLKILPFAFYLSAAATALVIMLANTQRKKFFYYLLLDGTMILQFLLVLLAVKIND